MTAEEIREVIREVLAEQRQDVLITFGFDEKDSIELRADFAHLRRWRRSVEQAQSYTLRAIVTVIATGVIGALWMGIKTMLGDK